MGSAIWSTSRSDLRFGDPENAHLGGTSARAAADAAVMCSCVDHFVPTSGTSEYRLCGALQHSHRGPGCGWEPVLVQ